MSQITLARDNHGNSCNDGRRNAQDVGVQIVCMKDLKTAAPQESRQPKHLVQAARRIETALGIKLADLHRTSCEPFQQRPLGTQATERDIVPSGIESSGEFNRLDFGPAHIQGINEVKNFPPGSRFSRRSVSPGLPSY